MTNETKLTTWTDAAGRKWTAFIGVGLATELRTQGLDLLNPQTLSELYQDPFKLIELNAHAHRDQLTEEGVTIADFIELATVDERVARESLAALEAALEDFFRRIRRGALAEVIHKASAAAAATDAKQIAILNTERAELAIAAEMDRATKPLKDALELAISGQKSGNSPGS